MTDDSRSHAWLIAGTTATSPKEAMPDVVHQYRRSRQRLQGGPLRYQDGRRSWNAFGCVSSRPRAPEAWPRCSLLEQFKPLAGSCRLHDGETGRVAARPHRAPHKAAADRIGDADKNDGDGMRSEPSQACQADRATTNRPCVRCVTAASVSKVERKSPALSSRRQRTASKNASAVPRSLYTDFCNISCHALPISPIDPPDERLGLEERPRTENRALGYVQGYNGRSVMAPLRGVPVVSQFFS
jgi:hypothetical protein